MFQKPIFIMLLVLLISSCDTKESLSDGGGSLPDVLSSDLHQDDLSQQDKTTSSSPDKTPILVCPSWECKDPDCSQLIQMPGPAAPIPKEELPDIEKLGYALASGKQYSWVRKDLSKILVWAVCEVRLKFPKVKPLHFSDMSQQDGKTPGTDEGQPRHPTTTHVQGRDIDAAYYQTDGENNLQIICGDGSDKNSNGYPGKYNDGYFCTTKQNIVDWGPQVWFYAKLFSTKKARVFGIDQMLITDFGNKLKEFYDKGEISKEVYAEGNQRVAWGAEGGWQFHQHHTHLSFQ